MIQIYNIVQWENLIHLDPIIFVFAGKTMQCSAFVAGLFQSRLVRRVLVVAPKTLLLHWAKELSVCGLGSRTHNYYTSSESERAQVWGHVCILHYTSIWLLLVALISLPGHQRPYALWHRLVPQPVVFC